jgi:hypothetical protein
LKTDINKEDELLFLTHTSAEISLLKENKLVGTTECDPEKKMKVKCVDVSPMETHAFLESRIELSNSLIVHDFQFLN